MSAMNHTPEPWHVATNPGGPEDQPAFPSIRDNSNRPDGEDIIAMPLGFPEEVKANAARIVACVNALAGINPEAINCVVETLRDYVSRCPNCGGVGWYAKHSYANPPEQEQCEWCDRGLLALTMIGAKGNA